MKSWTLCSLALAISLLIGCSKQSPQDSTPKEMDAGVVELTYGTPTRHDLGDGAVCVFTANPIGAGDIELLATLEKRGQKPETRRVLPAKVNQPVQLSFSGLTLTVTPRIK